MKDEFTITAATIWNLCWVDGVRQGLVLLGQFQNVLENEKDSQHMVGK